MNNDELEAAKPRYWRESSLEAVHFCQRLRLENGVTLLYDDQRGLAEGSDGRIYYAGSFPLPLGRQFFSPPLRQGRIISTTERPS